MASDGEVAGIVLFIILIVSFLCWVSFNYGIVRANEKKRKAMEDADFVPVGAKKSRRSLKNVVKKIMLVRKINPEGLASGMINMVDLEDGEVSDDARLKAERQLKEAMETAKPEHIIAGISNAVLHNAREELVYGARTLVMRLTDGFLGFEGPGAWRKKIEIEEADELRRANLRKQEIQAIEDLRMEREKVVAAQKELRDKVAAQEHLVQAAAKREEGLNKATAKFKEQERRILEAAELSKRDLQAALAKSKTRQKGREEALVKAMESLWTNLFGESGGEVQPLFFEAQAKLTALRAEDTIQQAIARRLADGDAFHDTGLGSTLESHRDVPLVDQALVQKALTIKALRYGIMEHDQEKIASAQRSGAVGDKPLHKAAAITLERLSAIRAVEVATRQANANMLAQALEHCREVLEKGRHRRIALLTPRDPNGDPPPDALPGSVPSSTPGSKRGSRETIGSKRGSRETIGSKRGSREDISPPSGAGDALDPDGLGIDDVEVEVVEIGSAVKELKEKLNAGEVMLVMQRQLDAEAEAEEQGVEDRTTFYHALTEAKERASEWVWEGDMLLRPTYSKVIDKLKVLQGESEVHLNLRRRLAQPDAFVGTGLDSCLRRFASVEMRPQLLAKAKNINLLKQGVVEEKPDMILEAQSRGATGDEPLYQSADIALARLQAEEKITHAMDQEDLPLLHAAIQAGRAAARRWDEWGMIPGGQKGVLRRLLPSAEILESQLQAVEEMTMAAVSKSAEALASSIDRAKKAEQEAVRVGAETSIQSSIAQHLHLLRRLRAEGDLKAAIDSRDLARLQAALDTAENCGYKGVFMEAARTMLQDVRKHQVEGRFNPLAYTAAGRRSTPSFLLNPQYKIEIMSDQPTTLSITMAEGSLGAGGEDGADDHDYFGPFALDIVRNKKGTPISVGQILPDYEEVEASEYSENTTALVLHNMDPADGPVYVVPSTFNRGEAGPFTLTVIVQTAFVDVDFQPVNKVEDQIVEVMGQIDFDWEDAEDELFGARELQGLLKRAQDIGIESNEVTEQGAQLVHKVELEKRLKDTMDAAQPTAEQRARLAVFNSHKFWKDHGENALDEMTASLATRSEMNRMVTALADALDGCGGEGVVSDAMRGMAVQVLAQLRAKAAMDSALRARDPSAMQIGISQGQAASLDQETMQKYVRALRLLKAESELADALRPRIDIGRLQAAYDGGLSAGLRGRNMEEADKLLSANAMLRTRLSGHFSAKTSGGGHNTVTFDPLWLQNPQYRVVATGREAVEVSATIVEGADADGDGEVDEGEGDYFGAYALHVVEASVREGGTQQAARGDPIVASTTYEDGARLIQFRAQPDREYFVVASTQEKGETGPFAITFFGPCDRLTQAPMFEVKAVEAINVALDALERDLRPHFRALPDARCWEAMEEAVLLLEKGDALGLEALPAMRTARALVAQLKACKAMDDAAAASTPAETNAGAFRHGLVAAKLAGLPGAILTKYNQLASLLSMESELLRSVAACSKAKKGDVTEAHAQLLASVCRARNMGYSGEGLKEAEEVLAKFHTDTISGEFVGKSAGGPIEGGRWRDNPQYCVKIDKAKAEEAAGGVAGAFKDVHHVKIALAMIEGGPAGFGVTAMSRRASAAGMDVEAQGPDPAEVASRATAALVGETSARSIGSVTSQVGGSKGAAPMYEEFAFTVARNARPQPDFMNGLGPGYEVVNTTKYDPDFGVLVVEVDLERGPYFVVPSTRQRYEEGVYTLAMLSSKEPVAFERVERSAGSTALVFDSTWKAGVMQGPYHKPGEDVEAKGFRPSKTWMNNPQFRVWLSPDDLEASKGDPAKKKKKKKKKIVDPSDRFPAVNVMAVLTTSCKEGVGLHCVRNKQCQFYNEVAEVLPDRYQLYIDGTKDYETTGELSVSMVLDRDQGCEDEKTGCEDDFPFFLVPSLAHKKAHGEFSLEVYADADVVVEMIMEDDRKV